MKLFGTLPDGKPVKIFTLRSSVIEMTVAEFGGRVVSLKTPDRHGKLNDITLGYDTLDDYLKERAFFGALIGRYGNRIANGRFSLNGHSYQLPQNNGSNCLHGGAGYHNCLWQVDEQSLTDSSATMSYRSHDGDDGFPGNLEIVVNLTQHAYFNLAGAGHASILNHELMLHADRYTPVDSTLIPTGELSTVAGTPFDFRQAHRIGERIDNHHEQLKPGIGYDHNWVLNNQNGDLALAAEAYEPTTGRIMQVLTTEPGIQFYSGNHLNDALPGKSQQRYVRRSGFCLETQHYPDSPNHPNFPSTTLKSGDIYQSTTIYRFSSK